MEETKVKQIIELLSIYQSTDLSELTDEDRDLIKYDLEEKKKNLDDQLAELYEKGANPIDDAEEVNLMENTIKDIEDFINSMEYDGNISDEEEQTEEIFDALDSLADGDIEADNINLENEIRQEISNEELSDEEIIDKKLEELDDLEDLEENNEEIFSQSSVNQFADSETLGADFGIDNDEEVFFNNLDLEDEVNDEVVEPIESVETSEIFEVSEPREVNEETLFNNLEVEEEVEDTPVEQTEEIFDEIEINEEPQEEIVPDEILQDEEVINEAVEEDLEEQEEKLFDENEYNQDFVEDVNDNENIDYNDEVEFATEEDSEYYDRYDDEDEYADEYAISDEEEFTIVDDSIYEEDDLRDLEPDNNRMMKIFSSHPNNQSLDSAKAVVDERVGLTIEEVTAAGEKISHSLMRKIASTNVNKK